MGEAWLNRSFGLKSHAAGEQQGHSHTAGSGGFLEPLSLSGSIELEQALNLSNNRLLLVPQESTPKKRSNVHKLVRHAVNKDPKGQSLNPQTLAMLQQAPDDPLGFGI